MARCGEPGQTPCQPAERRVEDTATFSNELERDNRRDTAPTYADYIHERNRRLRQFRTDLARDIPLFRTPPASPMTPTTPSPCLSYSGAKIGDVLAKIGPPMSPSKGLIVTDLSIMGGLIDTLI